ncbi:MAG: hypothetical protein AAGC55_04050, partial [Myxococcota bacterium]
GNQRIIGAAPDLGALEFCAGDQCEKAGPGDKAGQASLAAGGAGAATGPDLAKTDVATIARNAPPVGASEGGKSNEVASKTSGCCKSQTYAYPPTGTVVLGLLFLLFIGRRRAR